MWRLKVHKLLPILISAIVLYFCVRHVDAIMLEEMMSCISSTKTSYHRLALFIAFFLFIAHPVLEALKWQSLLGNIMTTSFQDAWRMTMRGMSSALMMPNKSGDFIGKLYAIPKSERAKAFVLSSVGNLLQLAQTLVWGLVAMIWYIVYAPSVLKSIKLHSSQTLFLLISILILSFVIFYIVKKYFSHTSWYKKGQEGLHAFRLLSSSQVLFVTLLSGLRYFIFISQYALIFYALGAELSWLQVFIAQSAIYFCLAFLPHTLLMDIALRAPLSLFFYAFFGVSEGHILLAAYSIYFLNILLPALSGLHFYRSIRQETQS